MQTPWLLLLGSLRERLKRDSDRRADETNGEATVVATDFVSSNEEARESWREGKEKKKSQSKERINCWNPLDLYFLALLGNKIFFPRKFRKISRKLIRISFRKD